MDFRISSDDLSFREEVETFVRREWSLGIAGGFTGEASEEEHAGSLAFRKKLAERSWLTMAWPREWGGLGAGQVRQALYNEVMGYYGAPGFDMGVDRVGPTIILFGSPEQRAEFLPKITNVEIEWCQGFSEPNAGSDLGALQTRAIATATGSWSTARRSGRRSRTGRTGCCCWRAPRRMRRSTVGSRCCCWTCGRRASPSGRCTTSPAHMGSTRSTSTTSRCRGTSSSAN